MQKALASLALASLSSAAFAGSYVAPNIESAIIEAPQTMGGSDSWIIPLVLLGVLILTLTLGEPVQD